MNNIEIQKQVINYLKEQLEIQQEVLNLIKETNTKDTNM
jgi:hypothetical protein